MMITDQQYEAMVLKLAKPGQDIRASLTPEKARILHSICGLSSEVGELMDAIKKSKIYGRSLDRVNLVEEMGDVMWYFAILADELGVSFEEIWEKNINKLRQRYPEKYSDASFDQRDVVAERKILES